MTHYLTNEEALIRDLKATKRNYQLDDCPKTSKYVGKCIKAIKWCWKNDIRGAKAGDVLQVRNEGIGDGMCCKWCEDIKRPDNPEPGQICEYEQTEKVYYREV